MKWCRVEAHVEWKAGDIFKFRGGYETAYGVVVTKCKYNSLAAVVLFYHNWHFDYTPPPPARLGVLINFGMPTIATSSSKAWKLIDKEGQN